ncbi:hypothetical protein D6D13_09303 [Aureobasidium pullulans]|uniref:Uncharacterized protein n=1 Tax=Aureobasidium pullulans TaxID=5580 RepID=A0A4S9C2W2_AURPU|nr:hypothetical protein D6D13_09303 [Aureobasidium pullulans]
MARDIKRDMMLLASCQCTRNDGGSCGTTLYTIKRFSVAPQYDKPDGKCMTFPEARQKEGATSGLCSFQTALAAVFIASVMVV